MGVWKKVEPVSYPVIFRGWRRKLKCKEFPLSIRKAFVW